MKYAAYVADATSGDKPGLAILEVDEETGKFRVAGRAQAARAGYVTVNRAGTRVYVTGREDAFGGGAAGHDGGVTVWAAKGLALTRLGGVASGYAAPCHLALTPDEKGVVWAEYTGATIGAADLDENSNVCARAYGPVQHTGTPGPDKGRQDKAHAHCAQVTPDGKYLCIVDLGLDEVKVYDYAGRKMGPGGLKELPAKSFKTSPAGAGPRHILFHPNGKLALIIFELQNMVATYRYKDGTFEHIRTLSTIPEGFTAFSKASAIRLSPDGKTVVCSNRGHDSLAFFALNPETGDLTRLAIRSTGATFPWDFVFTPNGKFILVAMEKTGTLKSFSYDSGTCTMREVFAEKAFERPRGLAVGASI